MGAETRARESHFLHEEQALENACLEIYLLKLRDECREEFVHLDLKSRKTNWLIKVIFS